MIDDRFENLLEDFLRGWRKFCFLNGHLLASLLHCFVRGMLAHILVVVAVTRLEMFGF